MKVAQPEWGLGNWWLPTVSDPTGAPDEHPQQCTYQAF
jgi:hypothetical protein